MSLWSWLSNKLGGTVKPTGVAAPSSSLPPLPVGSIAAVADALTQTGRIAEQQTALRNTPAMQQAKIAAQDTAIKDKIENDVATQNIDATRRELAD